MEDKLDLIFRMQSRFQYVFNLHPELKDIASAIASESGELWKASGGKWWSQKEYSREEKVEEVIDILHFLLAACIELDMTPQELVDVYSYKLSENYRRQRQKGGYKG